MNGLFVIIFWVLVVVAVLGYVLWRAQGDSKRTGLSSGIGSVEHIDSDDSDDQSDNQVGRLAGQPMSFAPQPGVHERARQEREQVSTESTMESPVYLGKGSTAVSVRAVEPGTGAHDRASADKESRPDDSASSGADGSTASADEEFSSTFDRIVRYDNLDKF